MITNRIVEILAWPIHYVHLELTYILTYITGKLNISGKQNKIQSIFQLYTWPFPSLSCSNSYIRLEGWVGVWGMWQALDGPGDGKGVLLRAGWACRTAIGARTVIERTELSLSDAELGQLMIRRLLQNRRRSWENLDHPAWVQMDINKYEDDVEAFFHHIFSQLS